MKVGVYIFVIKVRRVFIIVDLWLGVLKRINVILGQIEQCGIIRIKGYLIKNRMNGVEDYVFLLVFFICSLNYCVRFKK